MSWSPLPKRNLAFIDTETTGLDPSINEMIEFAGILMNPQGDIVEKIEFKIKPLHIETAHPKALEVNGYTAEEWTDAIDPETAAKDILRFCEGCVVVGHNIRFDIGFIEALFKKYRIGKRVDHHLCDSITLALEHLVPLGLDSVSLVNVCKFLDISNEGAHGAYRDVERCIAVYQKLNRATWLDRLVWKHRNRHHS